MDYSDNNLDNLIRRAEQGDSEAQLDLGIHYISKGYATGGGDELAFYWFRKAAEQGELNAMFNLGTCYYIGQGVQQDIQEAFRWWHQAAEGGYLTAQLNLARAHESGKFLVKDVNRAFYWYKRAAEQDNAEAQSMLGDFYSSGEGPQIDPSKAAYWWRKAAEQGHAESQYNLAVCITKGFGTAKDPARAYAWFSLAAKSMGKAREAQDSWGQFIGAGARLDGERLAATISREIDQRRTD